MEKIKDYFINFVLFLVYFIIVLFCSCIQQFFRLVLVGLFYSLCIMELDFIKQLSKETFGYLYIAATRLSQKSMQVIFSIAKRELFLYLSLVYKSASQQSLQKKTRDFDSYK